MERGSGVDDDGDGEIDEPVNMAPANVRWAGASEVTPDLAAGADPTRDLVPIHSRGIPLVPPEQLLRDRTEEEVYTARLDQKGDARTFDHTADLDGDGLGELFAKGWASYDREATQACSGASLTVGDRRPLEADHRWTDVPRGFGAVGGDVTGDGVSEVKVTEERGEAAKTTGDRTWLADPGASARLVLSLLRVRSSVVVRSGAARRPVSPATVAGRKQSRPLERRGRPRRPIWLLDPTAADGEIPSRAGSTFQIGDSGVPDDALTVGDGDGHDEVVGGRGPIGSGLDYGSVWLLPGVAMPLPCTHGPQGAVMTLVSDMGGIHGDMLGQELSARDLLGDGKLSLVLAGDDDVAGVSFDIARR